MSCSEADEVDSERLSGLDSDLPISAPREKDMCKEEVPISAPQDKEMYKDEIDENGDTPLAHVSDGNGDTPLAHVSDGNGDSSSVSL